MKKISKKSKIHLLCTGLLCLGYGFAMAAQENKPLETPIPPDNLEKINLKQLSSAQIAQYIGWVNQAEPQNICKGYYVEPNLYYKENYVGDPDQGPIHISADESQFSQEGTSVLTGNVQVTQPNRSISSDLAYLNRDPQSQKLQSVDVFGKVILREPGKLAIGDKGHFNLDDKSGSLQDVIYRMAYGDIVLPSDTSAQELKISSLNGWGVAKQVTREPSGVITVLKGNYTACPPPTNIWRISADNLTLNNDTGRGTAKQAVLYVKDVPILYTPYFNFPLDDRRQTGFLYPTVGHSSRSGSEVGIPFYWNIAPNYDATITPDYMSIRGLQLNGEFRYLTEKGGGNLHGSFLPHDREFISFKNDEPQKILNDNPSSAEISEINRLEDSSNSRYFLSYQDTHRFNEYWSSYLYLNQASDDYYFEDFNDDPAQITQNQIINEADLYFNSEHWSFAGQLQGYQTLHPVNQGFVANQYKKLPELRLAGHYPDIGDAYNFQIQNQFDNFGINNNPGMDSTTVNGDRLYINPDLSRPRYWTWGFFNPDIQLALRQYDLKHQTPGDKSDITSALPILNIDSGLFFDRYSEFLGHPYQQTFEPRLFYLYVPYQNQNDIPLFDTTVDPFSYSQLFRTNRFTGFDRIGDTNQVSLGATTRFINTENGQERLRASVGQIYYFEKRRVNIDESTLDLVTIDNQVPVENYSSPLAGELEFFLNQYWTATGNIAWDPNYVHTNNANVLLQYKRDNTHILNLGYNFLRGGDAFTPNDSLPLAQNSPKNNLNQTDFSVVWDLSHQWTFLGRWNYNISHNYPQTYYAGLQYEACCWAFRVVGGREFDYLDMRNKPVFDNRIYFEVALKTLGNVGFNNPTKMLQQDIPGYQDRFGSVGTM